VTVAVVAAIAAIVVAGPVAPRKAGASDAAVELVGKRTATSETFRNADGTFTTSAYATPIHYLDASGAWQKIDSTLVDSPLQAYAWTNRANAFHVHFKNELGADYLRFAAHGRGVTLSLQGALKAQAAARGSHIGYAGALPDVALDYDVRPTGLEETLTLASATVPNEYRFTLDPNGVPLSPRRLANGSWEFMTPQVHGPLFVLAAPRAVDAAGKDGSPHAKIDVQRSGKTFAVTLSVDATWLHDPARAFPVRLDPTITLQPASQTGNFITTCGTCTDTATPLWIGTDDTDVWRALVQFDLSSIAPGATVTSATLGLWNDSTSCVYAGNGDCETSSHTLEAHRVTKAWDNVNTTSSQLGFDATVLSTYTLAAHAPDGWMSWNVATTAQNWLNGTQPNYGILLKRSTEPLGAGGPAPPGNDASDPTQAPKLDITYKSDGVILYKPATLHANGADLKWSQWDGSSGNAFGGYEIHRSQSASFTPSAATLVATIKDPAITSYRDTTAAPSKSFTYKIVVNGVVSVAQTVTLPADGQASVASTVLTPQTSQETYLEDVTGTTDCNNYGGSDALYIGTDTDGAGTNWKYRPILTFDVRNIPAAATVTSANLKLYADYMPPATNVTVEAHRVTSSWKEGTGGLWTSPDYCTGDGATWLETQGGVRWNTAGGDFDPSVAASVTHTANDQAKWDTFNLASIVQQWVSGTSPNLGVLFKFSNETPLSTNWFAYDSDYDSWDPTLKPTLSLTYTDGSHSIAPTVSIGSPAPSANVGGTVTVSAGASDDGQVAKVDFYVDNVLKSTSTAAPYQYSWNTTTYAAGSHSVKAVATDNAGNQATSSLVTVNVDNSAAPSTSVTSPVGGTNVSGNAAVTASASDDRSVTHVEFYVDGNRFTDTATAPYTAMLNTLDATEPVYDGSHDLTSKAYDAGGHVTTSATVTINVKNAPSGSAYADSFTGTEFPAVVTYDPTLQTQQNSGVTVTVTNKSTVSWGSNVSLRYRWVSNDPTPVYSDGPSVGLGGTIAPNGTATITMMVPAPALPDGVERSRYTLRFDLYDSSTSSWFAAKGAQPLENPVIVNKALVREALGLEGYYQYASRNMGAGMKQLTNVANGNSILRWEPFNEPGRGLPTVLDLTYNALEKKCDCPAGNNWSLAISSLSRFGNPIDIHPNKADQIAGNANKFIEYTDGDGTTHRFTDSNNDGSWEAPAGVHLYLRPTGSTDPNKYWALTRPDRVTYYYDQSGFPQSVVDANGNTLTFTESSVAPADDPGGPKFKITKVTDAGGRAFTVNYFTKADAKKPQIRGKVKSIVDHAGRTLLFDYYFDGNLLRITQQGGTNADGSFLPDRSFVFTYTTSDGSGPAIPLAANRVNPDPGTSNESTRIYSIRDPRGNETLFSYLGPGFGTDRWKLASLTDRAANPTTVAYDTTNRVTTITEPLTRVSKYAYDTDGKVTQFTNPLNQGTSFAWNSDRMQTKVTEPTGAYTEVAYNNNGVVTDMWDQLRNHTTFEYQNIAVDGNDVTGKWEPGRTIPHISQLVKVTAPKGGQTVLTRDSNGNLTKITDAGGFATSYVYNADGTLASQTDANNHTSTYPSYDANGLATKEVDPAGTTTQFGFGADGRMLWSQDANHASDNGSDVRSYRTYFDYDSFGRLGRESEPKSTKIERANLIWTDYSFDPNDNKTGETAPHYGTSDGAAPVTTMAYDVMDRQTSQVAPHDLGSANVPDRTRTTQMAWDAAGRLTTMTYPKGAATTNTDKDFATFYGYDLLDRTLTSTEYAVDGTGAVTATHVTHFCYDLAGDLRSTTAPKGDASFTGCPAAVLPYSPTTASFTTKYTYDAAHHQTSQIDPLGNTESQAYDPNGNASSSTDPNGTVTTYGYDARDNMTSETQPFRGGTTPKNLVTRYEYDPAGNLKREISPRAYDTSTDKTTFTQYVTSFNYDANDQLTREDLPTGGGDNLQLYVHTAYDPNGNVAWTSLSTDQPNPALVLDVNKSLYTYWDTGMIRTSKDPAQPTDTFDYDAGGGQTSRTPAGEATESWKYYDDGLLRETHDPDGDQTSYVYDANDNLTNMTDSSGVKTPDETPISLQQTFDGFDGATKVRQQRLGQKWHYSTYAYDANGNITNAELNAVENGDGTTTAGRLLELGYDAADRVNLQTDRGLSLSCTDDQQTTPTYFANGKVKDLQVAVASAACTNTAPGWSTKQTTSRDYFLSGDLKTLTTLNGPPATGSVLQSHSVSYTNAADVYLNGNPASDTFTLASTSGTAPCRPGTASCVTTYSYDPRDRLISWDNGRGGGTQYALNIRGSVKTETTSTTTRNFVHGPGDQLTSITQGSKVTRYWYKHGDVFCVTEDASATDTSTVADCPQTAGATPSPKLRETYTWDDLDRLSAYRSFNGTSSTPTLDTQYSHDAFDRLTSENQTSSSGTLKTALQYTGVDDQLGSETLTGTTNATRTYSYDSGGGRESLTDTPSGGSAATYLYGFNPHGDVSLLESTASSSAAASYGYRAYGDADTGITQGNMGVNTYRFNAKRLDTGSPTLDTGARRFSSGITRFLSDDFSPDATEDSDVASDPTTTDRYGFAGGDPVRFRETDGHMFVPVDGGVTAPKPPAKPTMCHPWRRFYPLEVKGSPLGAPGGGTHSRTETAGSGPAYSWQDDDAVDISVGVGHRVCAPVKGLVGRIRFSTKWKWQIYVIHATLPRRCYMDAGHPKLSKNGICMFIQHNSKVYVKDGQGVVRGQRIALSGQPQGSGAHMHLAVNPIGDLCVIVPWVRTTYGRDACRYPPQYRKPTP
jgi:RHS repeat-associated protein